MARSWEADDGFKSGRREDSTLRRAAVLELNRARLNYGAVQGGSVATRPQTVHIGYSGDVALNREATGNQPWITVAPTAGAGSAHLMVTVDPTSLGAGSSAGTVTASGPAAAKSPRTVPVYLVASTPLQPEGAFGRVIGEDPNGDWTLDITDDAGGDDGTLVSWSLDITTCTCEVPVELLSLQVD